MFEIYFFKGLNVTLCYFKMFKLEFKKKSQVILCLSMKPLVFVSSCPGNWVSEPITGFCALVININETQ